MPLNPVNYSSLLSHCFSLSSCCALLSSSRRAGWLFRHLLTHHPLVVSLSGHATLSLSCHTSWLLYHLSLSSLVGISVVQTPDLGQGGAHAGGVASWQEEVHLHLTCVQSHPPWSWYRQQWPAFRHHCVAVTPSVTVVLLSRRWLPLPLRCLLPSLPSYCHCAFHWPSLSPRPSPLPSCWPSMSLPLRCRCAIHCHHCRRVAVTPSIAVAVVLSIATTTTTTIAPTIAVNAVVLPLLHLLPLLLRRSSPSHCNCIVVATPSCCHCIAVMLPLHCHHIAVMPSIAAVAIALPSHRPSQFITVAVALLLRRHVAVIATAVAANFAAENHHLHLLLLISLLGDCCVVVCHLLPPSHAVMQPLTLSLPGRFHCQSLSTTATAATAAAAAAAGLPPPPQSPLWSSSLLYIDKERGSSSTTTSVPTAALSWKKYKSWQLGLI